MWGLIIAVLVGVGVGIAATFFFLAFLAAAIGRRAGAGGRTSRDVVTVDIRSCARCGENHDALGFEKLDRPCGRDTHWAMCPNSAEPILMSVFKDEDLDELFAELGDKNDRN